MPKKEINYTELLLMASKGPKGETRKGPGFIPFLGAVQKHIDKIQNRKKRAVEQEKFDEACDYGP